MAESKTETAIVENTYHPRHRKRHVETRRPPNRPTSHRRLTPHHEDSAHSAEKLSLYKTRFAVVAEQLMDEGQLPNNEFLKGRLAVIRRTPILVTNDPKQESHYYNPQSGNIMVIDLAYQLITDHEMTHVLLPAVNWGVLNEGITQKVTRKIHTRMNHAEAVHRKPLEHDFYQFNEQIVDQITRITGLTLQNMIAIASDPNIADPLEEINNRSQITINGRPMGLIAYGQELDNQAVADSQKAEYNNPPMNFKERGEFRAQRILTGLSKIPGHFPIPE